jgi:uncharacterized protein YkwD
MRGTGHPRARFLFATFLAASALVGSAGTADATTVTPRNTVEPSLVSRINDVRAAHGLRALRVSSELTAAATRHGKSMGYKGYFRHELRRNGTWVSYGRWVHWYWPGPGYSSWAAGENLAWGAPDLGAGKTVTWWMNSAPHRANILGRWRFVGVAVVHVTAPAGYYRDYPEVTIAVADFGRRS